MEAWVKVGRRWALVALSGAWLSFSACGPIRPARAPGAAALNFEVSERRLSNGLRLVAHPDPSSGLTSAVLLVGAGAGCDPEGKEGLAHLVEHLAFRALDDEGRSRRRRLDGLSASYTGWADVEATAYTATVPRHRSEALLEIFADLMEEPLRGVDETTFRVERDVVENERRLRSENGYPSEIFARLKRALYGASYFGKPVGGSAASLSSLTLADAVEFARDHYRPERMTLVVAGGAGRDGEALARAFGEIRREGSSAGQANRALPGRATGGGLTPVERARAVVGTPELWLAWRLPGGFARERAKLEVLAEMVADSLQRVTRDRRDVGFVESFVDYGPAVSTLYCRASLSATDDVDGVRRSLAHALDRGVAQVAFDAYFRQIYTRGHASRRMLSFEPIARRAEEMALGAHYANDPSFAIHQVAAMEGLTGSELNDLADLYLGLEQSRALLVEPGRAGEGAELSRELAHEHASGEPTGVGTPGRTVADPKIATVELENGLEVIAIERPGDRFYTALLGFLDGEARTPLPVAQAARFATINYLVKAPAGIDFSKELGADSVSWLARSNASALDLGIERLIERFTNVGFNWKSPHFVEWRKVAEKLETADEKADRELYRALLGDSLLTIPRPEDFDSIRVQDIRKWRDAVHRPENASLIVVGPDSAEALDSARKHLSSWKRSVPRAPRVRPPALPRVRRSGLSLALLAKPGSSQTVLRLACRLPKHTPESIAAEEVLAERVRHVLDRTLREELGSSYYVHAEVDRIRGGLSVLRISTAVGNSRVEGSVPLLLESLTLPGFDEAAIAASREALLSGFVFETSTTAGLARRIFEQRRLGFRPELYSSFEKRLARVSPGAIEALLAACRKSAVLSAVGDVDEVERVAAPFVAELR